MWARGPLASPNLASRCRPTQDQLGRRSRYRRAGVFAWRGGQACRPPRPLGRVPDPPVEISSNARCLQSFAGRHFGALVRRRRGRPRRRWEDTWAMAVGVDGLPCLAGCAADGGVASSHNSANVGTLLSAQTRGFHELLAAATTCNLPVGRRHTC